MSFSDFGKLQRIVEMETATNIRLAIVKPAANIDLKHVVLTIYKHGTAGGSETLAIRLHQFAAANADNFVGALANSTAVTLASIVDTAEYWIGRVRFDFATPVPLKSGKQYALSLVPTSYTKTGSFYIAAVLDWNGPIYHQARPLNPAASIALTGYM